MKSWKLLKIFHLQLVYIVIIIIMAIAIIVFCRCCCCWGCCLFCCWWLSSLHDCCLRNSFFSFFLFFFFSSIFVFFLPNQTVFKAFLRRSMDLCSVNHCRWFKALGKKVFFYFFFASYSYLFSLMQKEIVNNTNHRHISLHNRKSS